MTEAASSSGGTSGGPVSAGTDPVTGKRLWHWWQPDTWDNYAGLIARFIRPVLGDLR